MCFCWKRSGEVQNKMLTLTPPPSTSISHILFLEVPNSSIFQINFNQQQSTLISCMMLMLSTNICNWEIEASYVAHLSFMSILQSIPESKFQINSNWIYFCWCEQGQHIVVNFPYGEIVKFPWNCEIVLKVSFAETRLPAFVWKFQCWPFPAKVYASKNWQKEKLKWIWTEIELPN